MESNNQPTNNGESFDRQPLDRRGWFVAALRGSALFVITIVSTLLLVRRGRGEDCQRQMPCQRCGLASRCVLPRAIQSRRNTTGSE